MEQQIQGIYDAVVEGQHKVVQQKVQDALDAGIGADVILNEGLVKSMAEVGRLFEEGEFFVPEMLIAARAMQAGLGLLKPHLVEANVQSTGKVVLGTVKGDLHDIGKNLVAMMLEGAGFEIVDLGVDATPEAFVKAVREGANLIGMSALLTTTMSNMSATIEALKAAGLRDQVKVMVGGAPVTEEFARSIGADAFAPDASSATRVARQLVA
jgi:5-methyltetrahydrofolate--homocysteine methyltransferase